MISPDIMYIVRKSLIQLCRIIFYTFLYSSLFIIIIIIIILIESFSLESEWQQFFLDFSDYSDYSSWS